MPSSSKKQIKAWMPISLAWKWDDQPFLTNDLGIRKERPEGVLGVFYTQCVVSFPFSKTKSPKKK